ncbi:MAG: hypothetical protein M3O41_12255 [Pseudomonadota bacterium]|nr:hypothetical protein [Pseudomonadota bacterium]
MRESKRTARVWSGAGMVAMLLLGALSAQGAAKQVKKVAPADFSGVWALSPKQGRTYDPDAGLKQQPPLKPEWKEQWDKTRARQVAGMRVWDPLSRCLPPGMPRTMSGSYPMEILMTPGRVTVLTELYNETRRIWTDGRGHPPPDELEYTFVGDSVGHWEGDTLVVDTVGVREESVLDVMFIPHSDQAHFTERARLKSKDELDWTITMEDPVVYTKPWTVTRKFVRAPPGEGVREFVCAENNQPDKYVDSPEDAYYEHPDPRLKTRD